MRIRSLAALAGAALLLAACGQQELYGGLTERDANEMVAVLKAQGLDASKTRDGDNWVLKADRSDFSRAVALLHDRGYPRQNFASMGEVFQKEGFVSSPMEQRMRMMYALQQELGQTISSIDGVVQARVHIAVPESDPLAQEKPPSSASVFIKHRPDYDISAQTGSIKALVVNSIEGLPYDKVTVVAFPASEVLTQPQTPAVTQLSLPLGVLILGAAGLGIYGLYRRPKPRAKSDAKRGEA
ncbi:type III secretion system inner membrane ring lipoprotein SctJ [Brevundimonas diminuta]|uniref:type III secretion system inner membrane ring lipoprotein SctJ n=1 Tax=Brevundimonas diminuta TaxID=293 RepID=UPI0032093A94